jgi:hypothetical protein
MRDLNCRHRAVGFAVAFLICTLTAQAVRAQQPTPPSSGGRRSSPSNPPASAPPATRTMESVNQRALDLEMLSTSGRRDRSADSGSSRLARQLIEDFDRLWKINVDTIAPQSAAELVDYKMLSQATSEIKKRATRIKSALALTIEDNKSEKVRYVLEAAKLGSVLAELDRVIKSFVGNPVFRVNSPNDTDLRLAAWNDLEAIITLSETVNKIAKSQSKSASPTK